MNNTIKYYEENAENFVKGTVDVNLYDIQNEFLKYLDKGSKILDFGCGSGRDTLYFLNQGYNVDAIDGSKELCKAASQLTNINVKNMMFNDLNEINTYDGIWACASILHLDKKNLLIVIKKMIMALKEEGYIYTSFKYGNYEGERNGRYFTDFTLESFNEFIKDINNIEIIKNWITGDARKGRENEKWLNLIMKKKNY